MALFTRQTSLSKWRASLLLLSAASAIFAAACSKSENPPAQSAAAATPAAVTPVQSATPVAVPSASQPAASPGVVAASPSAVPPALAQAGKDEMSKMKGGQVLKSDKQVVGDPNDTFGYKPPPTPTPAPTPKVVMVNGKIKQEWEAPAEYASMKSPFKFSPEFVKKGKELYMQRCEICHGSEGKGNGGYNSPKWKQSTNLASTVVQANSDGELFYKVTTNRDRHPASKLIYSEEERWAVVAFLRTFK